MMLEFGEYLPDLPARNNPGITVATNVLPLGGSYGSFPSFSIYSNALGARCQGARSGRDSAGNTYNFAGDATKLYSMSSAAWNDISKGGGYSVNDDERWSFTQWGSYMFASNYTDTMQKFLMGVDAAFSDVATTVPKARYIATVRDFVIAGNTFDAIDGAVPFRVWWSPIGAPTSNWTQSAVTQCDFQDINGENGWIQQVVGGEYGVIFQERGITRMTFVGSPLNFQFDEVESGQGWSGTPAPGSVIKVGNQIAYLGRDGFYMFNGTSSVPIGTNKVDRTFWADVDETYLNRICAAVDPNRQIIYWTYASSNATAGNPDKILAYNYAPTATKRWGTVVVDTEYLLQSFGESTSLDGLDAINTNLDALAFSLDSRVWTNQRTFLAGFNTSHKLGTFTGTALSATIETMEKQINEGYRTEVNLVRPAVEGATATTTIQLGTRNKQSDSVTYSNAVSENSAGNFSFRSNARFHRARVNISGGFDHAQGIEVLESVAVGIR